MVGILVIILASLLFTNHIFYHDNECKPLPTLLGNAQKNSFSFYAEAKNTVYQDDGYKLLPTLFDKEPLFLIRN